MTRNLREQLFSLEIGRTRDSATTSPLLFRYSATNVLITAPFKHHVATTVRRKPHAAIGHGQLHPIHRALHLEKCLRSDPRLSLRALAVRERIAPATLCQLRKLTQLCPDVQQALLAIKDRATAWRCSIRRIIPLVPRPPARQWQEFRKLTDSRRPAAARSRTKARPTIAAA